MQTARTLVVFLAAALMALDAAPAAAQFGGGMRGGRGEFNRPRPKADAQRPSVQEDPRSQTEFRLEMLHEDLRLSPDQEASWKPYADKVSALAADMAREHARLKQTLELKSLQRIDEAVDVARDRLTALEDIAAAARALYSRLTPEQQSLADARLATTLPAAAGFAGVAPARGRPGPAQ